MEVSSNNQSSNDSKPLQMEWHVASANSCNNNKSTRASLHLKRKREQSYESYHENPEVKRAKVKAIFNKNPQAKRDKVKAHYNRNPQGKYDSVKVAFNNDHKQNEIK